VVDLAGVTKAYGANPVVRGLDLRIGAGEIFTLLGPSGCGKTTTLRMIAGLEAPDAGTIRIGDEDVTRLPPERRRLGMVFQSYAVWPHRTVRENVAYPLTLRGEPDASAKADAALARVRLGGMGDRWPHTLSGGQQQRVALARALAARPRVLLLDEPLSNLDAGLREELRHLIVALAREERLTVVLVTHDQEEALGMSDRVGVMHEGRLAQVADPRTLYESPDTAFVARFVGTLNEVDGERRGGRLLVGGVDVGEASGADGAVRVAFRPEHARFADTGVPARVEASAFRGASTRYRVRIGDALVVVDASGDAGPCLRLDRTLIL
jgi:ABC-type Fe3+/spermidine/putrescine transport system ATPase subunit